ncbi:type II toxin-antitoxin system Phd/YefM family antitoxin [Methylomonas methanica]|uniref:Antitoxin n=1 Tax=Methylomonas methanica (strain DSM 25384 / MC09) TaxID=857087 RepID=F9ZYG5_METMM|nr:type II toxin-antitoxin system prevent-host-death family antitoxin [Methylomonas methanica]AEG02237.1 prevent-host-death family protein [Methylomonas methanica MC09]
MQVNILEAKNNLSSLVVAAERDEEVIIARNGVPVAKLVKYSVPKISPPGAWSQRVVYSADWDSAATNAEIADLFNGTDDASTA